MSEPFVGEIRMFAGNFAPRGWALCDGQLLAVSQNDALFSLLGTIYGGDGRTTFGLPDMRGRIPIHAGSGPGLTPRNLGVKAGSENVTLTLNEIPAHTHDYNGSSQTGDQNTAANNVVAGRTGDPTYVEDAASVNMASSAVGNSGGSDSHTNLMPCICINFIIALIGIYPSRH